MNYETYEPPSAERSRADDDSPAARGPLGDDGMGSHGPWRVLIEYSNGGQAKPPTVVQIGRSQHADHHTAMRAACRAAFEFEPPDPWSIQNREVYRDGPSGFVVILTGATATFHMSVRIVAAVTP